MPPPFISDGRSIRPLNRPAKQGKRTSYRGKLCSGAVLLLLMFTDLCYAHAAEQGYILLLPTNFFVGGGTVVVAFTVILMIFQDTRTTGITFRTRGIFQIPSYKTNYIVSLLSAAVLASLIVAGFLGNADPLQNVLPLFVWTIWWIGLVTLQALAGNSWHWINPWSGLAHFLNSAIGRRSAPLLKTSTKVQAWPAIPMFFIFMAYFLSSVMLNNPFHLAVLICLYSVLTLLGILLYGEKTWLRQFECFSIFLYLMSLLSPVGKSNGQYRIGLPGWKIVHHMTTPMSLGVFALLMLGCGSFDGLNETFWWLTTIDVNPLAYPGRSAIIVETVIGLLIFNIVLAAAFSICIYIGLRLAQLRTQDTSEVTYSMAFTKLALTLIPIAFAYHLAHFFTAFLVNIQYIPPALSDPLASGANHLALNNYHIKTGFLNDHHTVEIIWFIQLTIVVVGHIVSVVLAHAVSNDLFKQTKSAVISQLPLAIFMTAYTCLGLWLLSSPRMS